MTATADLSPFALQEIDREFRHAIAHTEAALVEVQIARALMDLGIVEAYPANVTLALSAAARINGGYLSASLIRRNYRFGQQTYDIVNAAVRAAEAR